MRGKAKQREMRALRAAGLTLAGAERLAQTRGGSTLALSALGSLGIVVLAGVGVLTMNLPSDEQATMAEPALAPAVVEPTTVQEQDEPVVAATAPTPAEGVADAIETATQSQPSQTIDDLPWMTALDQSRVSPPRIEESATTQDIEQDCVLALAGDVSGVLMQFDAGSAVIPTTSYDDLLQMGLQVNACPEARVLVAGHSDSSGSDLANLQLSWARAENTVEALSALGIETSQFETVGFGSRAPLEQGSSSDDGINRRVELRVLKGDSR